jgi:twinkle protein
VDNVLLVWRNKKKEAEAHKGGVQAAKNADPDAALICCKQRNGEWEGLISLWFDKRSQQFVQSPGAESMVLYNWPHR